MIRCTEISSWWNESKVLANWFWTFKQHMGNFCITVEGDRNHLEKEIQDSIYWKERKNKKWGQLMLRKIVWNKQMISGIFCYSGLSPREACMKLKSHQPLPVFLICKRQIWLLNQHLMLRWWGKFMDVWLYFTVSSRITTGKCIKPLNHLLHGRIKAHLHQATMNSSGNC